MKVLLTGSEGLVGSHAQDILKEDFQVITTDIQGEPDYLVDVKQRPEVFALMERIQPDVVVHLAAKAGDSTGGGTAASKEHPYDYIETNIRGTLNLLEACRKNDTSKFVYMSSFSTYGVTEESISEETEQEPTTSPYSVSKYSSEKILETYQECYGIEGVIFRAPLIVGEGQEEWNALNEFVDCALEGEDLVIYGEGTHKREWLHAEDVGRAYLDGINYLNSMEYGKRGHDSPEVFILGNGNNLISMKNLAKKVKNQVGRGKVRHKEVDMETWDQWTDTTKIQKTLGWVPKIGLDEIIRRTIDDRRERI